MMWGGGEFMNCVSLGECLVSVVCLSVCQSSKPVAMFRIAAR